LTRVGQAGHVDLGLEPDCVEQPAEIPKNCLTQPRLRQHAVLAWLHRLVRLVVDQTIKERRLQAFLWCELLSHARSSRRRRPLTE
jgi:hypothetical protein